MKIWKYIAILFMGVALGLCIAFKIKKPETVIRQEIKKMKNRGTGNTQEAAMNNVLPTQEKKSFLGKIFKRDPKKKAARKAWRTKKK